MIKLINIGKIYKNNVIETTALKNISFSVDDGEFVSIMGHSGSGKSTLLNIIGLIDSCNSGEYYFNNQCVSNYNEKQRTNLRKLNLSFVFQRFNLIEELNVYHNIELPLTFFNINPRERKKKILSIMEQLSIRNLSEKTPLELSGGQQQRVAVARALITNSKMLLADEPTGNLDSKNGQDVMNLLKEINREGTTVIMTTHSQEYANLGNRIINLFDGEVVTENFFNNAYQIQKKKIFY